jgi:Phage protein Gp138 N-terminal domain
MASQNNPILSTKPDGMSFAQGMRQLMDLQTQRFDGLLPAKVISYDRAKNIATVQPQIMLVDTDGNSRMRNPIAQLPVFSFGGGGFHINFPLKAGDLGWIFASDRDISLFMQTLTASKPNTMRRKRFGDGWFIPDVFYKYTINGADTNAMVIQSTDGTTRIAISNGVINITAPTSVTVDTPIATFTKDVHIQGKLTVDQDTALKANLVVTGLTTINGGFIALAGTGTVCTLPQNTTIGGIAVYGHGHIQTAVNGQRTSAGMVA